jgi:hypothetical protein
MARERTYLLALLAVIAWNAFTPPWANSQSVLLESAQMGTPGEDSGNSITDFQWIAWRFSTDVPLAVHRVGGHIYSIEEGGIFAAFIRLSAIDALPVGAPFNADEVVATTTFEPTFPSAETFTPIDATLAPGAYALVFGTGLFGATGLASMPNGLDQPDIPPTNLSSFIYWSPPGQGLPHQWRTNLASHMRFVVEADVIHLPGDYNVDGTVDAEDYAVWKDAYGTTGAENADGNGDLTVDAVDYTVWRNNFGNSIGAGGLAVAVPEPPGTAALFFALMLVTASRRR